MTSLPLDSMKAGAHEAASLMRALSHEGRLMIMCALCNREHSVSELTAVTGLSQSALSQHLALLRNEALVTTRREAQAVFYSLSNPAVKAIVRVLHKTYCPE